MTIEEKIGEELDKSMSIVNHLNKLLGDPYRKLGEGVVIEKNRKFQLWYHTEDKRDDTINKELRLTYEFTNPDSNLEERIPMIVQRFQMEKKNFTKEMERNFIIGFHHNFLNYIILATDSIDYLKRIDGNPIEIYTIKTLLTKGVLKTKLEKKLCIS